MLSKGLHTSYWTLRNKVWDTGDSQNCDLGLNFTLWPWENHLASLSLTFLIYKYKANATFLAQLWKHLAFSSGVPQENLSIENDLTDLFSQFS